MSLSFVLTRIELSNFVASYKLVESLACLVNGGKLNSFPLRLGATQGYLITLFLVNMVQEVLATAIEQEKDIKVSVMEDQKKRKVALCRNNPT